MLNLTVMPSAPDERWVSRLRQDNKVWLCKEKEFASIEWAWEPPKPGHKTGRIGIRRFRNNTFFQCQNWLISANGCGINGSRLFLPVEGHLCDNPPDIPEPEVRHIHRQLDHLRQRLDLLNTNVSVLMSKGKFWPEVNWEEVN